MTDHNSIHDDISYMRRLAETGRKGSILGGVFLAAAGGVFGVTCFVSWAWHKGLLPVSGLKELHLWLGAFAVFAVFWMIMFVRMLSYRRPVASAPNATFGTIWTACGIGVMVVFCTTLIIAQELNAPVPQTALRVSQN